MYRIRTYRTSLLIITPSWTERNIFAKKRLFLVWKLAKLEYKASLKPLKFNRTPALYRRDYGIHHQVANLEEKIKKTAEIWHPWHPCHKKERVPGTRGTHPYEGPEYVLPGGITLFVGTF